MAERIRRVMWAGYRVEADLLEVEVFPPLDRTSASIAASKGVFFGIERTGQLAAVIEVEDPSGELGELEIASLVVHPDHFRQGLGARLVAHVLDRRGARAVTVSTGRANEPAIRLYSSHGFREDRLWMTPCGIRMVTLRLDGRAR
ncbi:MAG: GNAT family N-acetyltransferase [Planctomycetes bacterium]|nr:GNAT family N-acetyltransferase [Planctomycetota bacterium]